MSFHEQYRQQFLQQAGGASPAAAMALAQPTSAVAAYGVRLEPARVSPDQPYWRLIGIHHLTPDENRGGHGVFVDVVDEGGQRVRDPSFRLRWGWEGQRPDEASPPKSFDKPENEPATTVELYLGQQLWVEVEGGGLASDRVANLHSKHADEAGPHGELWNTIGHHSFYLVFQRSRAATAALPVVEIPKPADAALQVITFGAVSHLDLLNAFAQSARKLGLGDPWTLLTRAGLNAAQLAANGWATYGGPPLHELPNLSVVEKNLLMQQLAHVLVTLPISPVGEASAPPSPAPVAPPAPAPSPTVEEVPPPAPAPSSPAANNRLGFYLHLSTDQDGLWEAIRQVQPPVILVHADTVNRMLLREIRAFRAPDAFVIGRLYKDNNSQRAMLTSGDPAARGREMAEEILALDFGLATERGANGRLLIDAWVSLNEAVPGPASRQFAEQPAETAAMLRAYDLFQSAFHSRLQEAGVEAVAFNFGAGNFSRPEHYLEHFPNTLATHTYLGFHEYGWPTLHPAQGSATSAGLYRTCMTGIRARFGPRHRVVITEAGLTRMYQEPSAGDVGWLNTEQPLSQEAYWQTLQWYNQHLAADDYVVGACLFEVGHHGNWATFRHLGRDNEGNPLQLMQQIAALNRGARGGRGESAESGASQPGSRESSRDFVRVRNGEFVAGGRPLRFVGVNIRGLVHYGDGRTLPFATRDHAREQIHAARSMGGRVIRVFLPSIHTDAQGTIERLRSLLDLLRAEAGDVYLLPALCNLYQDVEFRIPGDDGFYEKIDPNFPGNLLNAAFFNGGYRTNYLPFVQQVVQAFRDEPAIFAWEIGNELKLNPVNGASESDPNIAAFLNFMHTVAQEVRRIDPNHLVTTGMISTHHAWLHTPALRHRLYAGPDFDFLTVHCYNDERENDDSDLARELNKPFIVEEAGYGVKFGGDRSPKTREDMAIWFGKGARGYMPWGFMATSNDIGDGDRDSGLDRALHGDWNSLFSLFRSQSEQLAQQVAGVVFTEPSGTFQKNQVVYSTDWLNIRKSPGYLNKLGDDILGMFAPAQPATITGEAVAQDGLTWWPVQVTFDNGQRVDGWAAEANASMTLLSAQRVQAPSTESAPARPRGRGTAHGRGSGHTESSAAQALFATTYVNLRRTPGYVGKASDDLIGQIPYGAQVEPTGSSAMVDALTWQSLRAPLVDNSVAAGWAAEIDPNGIRLLSATEPSPPVTNVGGVIGTAFQPGDLCTLLGVTHLRSTAGLSTREAGALATLLPNGSLTITGGPELRGDLEWWQTTQSNGSGQTLAGWAPLTTDDGTRLLAAAGVAQRIHAARPFAEKWPITQGWGQNPQVYCTIPYDGVPLKGHNGLDFGTPVGTSLLATDEGKVIRADYEDGGFGHFVLLQHAWGESLYAHLERVDVPQGATVARGQSLGLSGNSGFSSGPHLHFGIRIYPYRRTDGWGGFVNPIPFLHLDIAESSPAQESGYVDRAPELPGWVRP
ncbi:MAG: peptidoglycan DD-metalloendopeptidase family protein [Caldilineaceae bacterium]|nr:peptidoglycan DD-metalloendopeptidase family protein [Caldilineaceae bacterium]